MICNDKGCVYPVIPRHLFCPFHVPKCAHVLRIVADPDKPSKVTCPQIALVGMRFCHQHLMAHGCAGGWNAK